jgi:hypothetical protein
MVPSYNQTNDMTTLDFTSSGWYIVPLVYWINPPGEYSDCNTQGYLKSTWIWSPTAKKYIGARYGQSPSAEDGNTITKDNQNKYLYSTQNLGGAWIYLSGPCKLSYYEYTSQSQGAASQLNQYKLAKGWNFFYLNPAFKDYSINELKGGCNLVKWASWDSNVQSWYNIPNNYSDTVLNTKINQGYLGRVILLKAAEECSMGLAASQVPPNMPE